MIRAATIAELDSPQITRLEAYWQGKRQGRLLPSRADIDPTEIKDLLPQIILVRIEHDPLRVKYAVIGTASAEAAGFDYTGRYLDEVSYGDGRAAVEHLVEGYLRCVETGTPHHGVYEWPTVSGYRRQIGFGLFPLLVGGVVGQCLSIEDYSDISPEMNLINWVAPVRGGR